MADVHSKETRSYNMSRIRSKDTKPGMLAHRFPLVYVTFTLWNL
jgi:DNA mismatch endonuclease (patch repair protein)